MNPEGPPIASILSLCRSLRSCHLVATTCYNPSISQKWTESVPWKQSNCRGSGIRKVFGTNWSISGRLKVLHPLCQWSQWPGGWAVCRLRLCFFQHGEESCNERQEKKGDTRTKTNTRTHWAVSRLCVQNICHFGGAAENQIDLCQFFYCVCGPGDQGVNWSFFAIW